MKNMRNLGDQPEYIIEKFISKDEIRTYKHYRNPVSGRLVNSGKRELISVERLTNTEEEVEG